MQKTVLKSNAWKISPGKNAEDWDVFRTNGCIGIGWLTDYDYTDFKNIGDVMATLEAEHGVGTPGFGKGGAEMVWTFTNELHPGHIVVANKGYNDIVGVGLVTGDYLPPDNQDNPMQGDETTHRHHVRAVDWLVAKPVHIPGSRFSVQRTLGHLDSNQISLIVEAYLNSYPEDAGIRLQLDRLVAATDCRASP
ncbi:hypothetical protein [Roseimaritima ulvae]|uniref:Uncharacterized protein n=1 Tax=Roseimaritima ulvae TaxID=980254 RepID=A0A5B9QZT5_9BACT|nr:hypothetical protein [Roseimaritima ulvae]QEG43440.1 hypothetical protein UC8_54890 [Roseimaritima ulvae]